MNQNETTTMLRTRGGIVVKKGGGEKTWPLGGDHMHRPRTPRRSAISAALGLSANMQPGCENLPSAGGAACATCRTLRAGMCRP